MSKRFRVPTNPFAITAILAFILIAVAGMSPASAQDSPTPTPTIEPTGMPEQTPPPDENPPMDDMTVGAVRCKDANCTELGDGIAGMEINAFDATNDQFLDGCVTDAATGTCVISMAPATTFALRFDHAAVPDGYVYYTGGIFVANDVTYIGFVPGEAPPEPATILVRAVLCADDDCDEIDSALIEFEIFAVDKDTGEVLNSCITGSSQEHATCLMDIAAGTHLLLQGDKEAVPDGYVRVPGHQTGDGDPPLFTLLYVPDDGDSTTPAPTPKAPVRSLPSTGTGSSGVSSQEPGLALAALSLTLVGIAAAAQLNARRSRR